VYVFYPSIDPCKREYEPMDMEKMLWGICQFAK
jgi:hypothetical protein